MKVTVASVLAATAGVATFAGPTSAFVLPSGARGFPKLPEKVDFASKRDAGSLRLPLTHHRRFNIDSPDGVLKFAQRQKGYVEHKYGARSGDVTKRQQAALTDVGPDSFYVAEVPVGTPAQTFDLVLDTGSSDMWIASSACTQTVCQQVTLYNAADSSTNVASQTPFSIQYGSGSVTGTLFADTMSLGGHTVYNATMAAVTDVESGAINSPASGIIGMGFQQLATSGATPFWEVLAKSNVLSVPAFTFQLARNQDVSTATTQSAGGIFTLGEIDSSQYTGDITYIDIPSTTIGDRGYWAIYMDSITVAGKVVSTANQYAAIDTGTTLIAGNPDAVASIYAAVPGAQTVTQNGQDTGYYAYPCTTTVSISLSFGGKDFTMNSADFNGGALGSGYCLGAIFEIDLSTTGLDWVVGDAFLKNVFSVFEFEPARVGFASLVGGTAQEVAAIETGAAAATGSATPAADVGTSTVVLPTASGAASSAGIVGGSGLPTPVASSGTAAAVASSPSSVASTTAPAAADTVAVTSIVSASTIALSSAGGESTIIAASTPARTSTAAASTGASSSSSSASSISNAGFGVLFSCVCAIAAGAFLAV
ncbi:acid protease [Microstroma glucosiphilum]|uniref:Acid protease n=1 Tax=Pseudomicrostroma glucosiphilum TaxID=1684307 RepID=A0A316U568_9BASI|nr:acid protease [Pseudomicrostroma glucosiphilum]PWN19978.1 acid protease [Pseudomicrostroma glucosiphilum]